MINKLEFNNLVTANKKNIEKIKTKIIQKLIQKIKKLKYILEKTPEHKKNKERFRKTTLSLEELKKLKCVDLIKRVLLLEKSPCSILTNGLSSPKEMAVAMVATDKTMQGLECIFREKLGITDDNQVWKKELMQVSKRRIKILRTEQKRKTRQHTKDQKAIARKRVEWLKHQNGELSVVNTDGENVEKDVKDDEGANVSTLGVWKIEPISDKSLKKSKKEKIRDKNIMSKVKVVIQNADRKKNVRDTLKPESKALHSEENRKLSESEVQTEANINEPSKRMSLGFDIDLESQKSPNVPKEGATHVIDPFFITATGENYRSTAVIVRNGQDIQKTAVKENQKSDEKYSKNEKFDNFRRDNKRFLNKNRATTAKENTRDIHPSWAAKQKLKPVIENFQGKKIKFEDNDYNNIELNHKNDTKLEHKNFTCKNKSNGNKNGKIEIGVKNLHPSWLAKQKQKPAIKDFEGRKIVFEDKDDEITKPQKLFKLTAPSKNSDALHPSWAAKQNFKHAITAFQGKKITFGDD